MAVISKETLDAVFSYHVPTPEQIERYQTIREAARDLADTILDCCPETPERTLALRDVQRAVQMANASIAINEPEAS